MGRYLQGEDLTEEWPQVHVKKTGPPPCWSSLISAAPKRKANTLSSRASQAGLYISRKIFTCARAASCRMRQDFTKGELPSSQWLREHIWHCWNRTGTRELLQKHMFTFLPHLHRNARCLSQEQRSVQAAPRQGWCCAATSSSSPNSMISSSDVILPHMFGLKSSTSVWFGLVLHLCMGHP